MDLLEFFNYFGIFSVVLFNGKEDSTLWTMLMLNVLHTWCSLETMSVRSWILIKDGQSAWELILCFKEIITLKLAPFFRVVVKILKGLKQKI